MINRYDNIFHEKNLFPISRKLLSFFLKRVREDHDMQKLKMFMKFSVLIAELNKRGDHIGSLMLFVRLRLYRVCMNGYFI